ncbi:MAG: Calx-beta domain-containing protein [Bacteroidota bacterium]
MKKFLLVLIVLKSTVPLFSQGGIRVDSGTTIKSSNGAYIVLNNAGLVNNGGIQHSGVIKFIGNTNVSLSGNGSSVLDKINLSLSPATMLSLLNNVIVDSEFSFSGGLLNLNNNKLDLGTSGLLTNESETSRAYTTGTGYIEAVKNLNAPSQVNTGNLGAIISSSANLGSTIIRRGHKIQNNIYGANNSLQRYYDIIPSTNTGLNATLRMRYFDAELNSIPEDTLSIWRSSDNINWTSIGFNTRSNSLNYVEKTAVGSFSRITLSQAVNTTGFKNISISNASITEGDAGTKELKFTVKLNSASSSIVSVQYATSDSTAIAGNDYNALSGTITFAPGQTADTIRVIINGDKVVEPDEYFLIQLINPVNGNITTGKAIGTIRNDDTYPSVAITNYNVREGNATDTTLLVQVRLTKSYPFTVSLNYATQDSTATAGEDYLGLSGVLTFASGDTIEYIPVTIKGDLFNEPNEILNINLSNPVNCLIGTNTRGRVTIVSDDPLPQVLFTNTSVAEGNNEQFNTQNFTARLNKSYPLPVTVNYQTQDSTATAGSDYQSSSGTLTFQPGDTLATIRIPVYGDKVTEPNEIIKLFFTDAVNATVSANAFRITITNDDALPGVVFASTSVAEGNNDQFNSIGFTVRLNRSYPLPVTVDYTTLDSTATNGIDYQPVNGTLTFLPGDTLETITIPVLGDRIVEPNEIIKLQFSNAVNTTVSANAYRITLTNDDSYPAINISNITVAEGDAGAVNAAFVVRINKRYPQDITVQYTTQDVTANAGVDYTMTSGTVTFPADGDTLQTINVPVLGDLLDEANETFKVQLSNPVNATISGAGSATGTITDNDAVPAIRVYDTTAAEASGNALLRVTLSAASGRQVSVVYKTQEGTALDTLDYIKVVADTLVFQPGETVKLINVSVLTDALTEGNETFSVILQSPVNGTVTASQGGDNTAVVTILNSAQVATRIINTAPIINVEQPVDALQVTTAPNPFQYNTEFKVISPESGELRILIYDVNGIKIAELKRDVIKGMPVSIPFRDDKPRQGMLLYKAIINRQSVTGKLMQMN